ncbi:hypothetical protein IWZ00DRAFT_337890 [Phyllosticta capitalensis]|uniref:Uncharacterized protein n=1 Tax=Phyllosticta capitalensis TaxID=121624 RepID=A0ABR1YFS6_9PEZI
MATSHPRYSLPPVGRKPSLNRHASYTSSPRLDDHVRAAASVPTHARLHKRGTSDSSAPTGSPTTSQSPDLAVLASRSMDTPTSSSQEEGRRSLDFVSARRLRPYLRKLHTREDNSLDLSLPAPDSGSPAGLGIHDYATGPRSVADVHFASATRRQQHNRSTSGNSMNSASSGGLRQPTAPFLRHTPRQFSDLSEHSQPGSIHEENALAEAVDIMSDDEFVYRQGIFDPQRRSGSMSSSTPNAQAPIHSFSSGSISRMPSRSQTSLSNLYDNTRSRRDTMKSELAHSPSSRTSLDKAIGFVRGRESPVDPASRAASIRALRAEFQAKEEAKERKLEKDALRKRDRDERKRAKHEDRYQRPEMEEINEKVDDAPAIPPRPVSGQTTGTSHNSGTPPYILQSNTTRTTRATTNKRRTRRPIRSRWAAFVAWFRTRLLRLKCL